MNFLPLRRVLKSIPFLSSLPNSARERVVLPLLFLILLSPNFVNAQQQNAPHIGYLYPAGGRQGETFDITVGGQYLNDESRAIISGSGIQAKVTACVKPLTPKQVNELRERLDELQKKPKDPAVVKEIREIRMKLGAFRGMMNPGIADKATVQITIDPNADLEPRELRLETAAGLSNPLAFHVGQLPEFRKKDLGPNIEFPGGPAQKGDPPQRKTTEDMDVMLPATVNGQIPPGGVDRYHFKARQGQRIVAAVSARELMPYLADAVPGWFQVAAAIYDSNGKELAYDDHYRFHPDPVLSFKIPKDGAYTLEIRDALYRGREDFVYRIAIGELPFVTSIFPLGGPADAETAVRISGWNVSADKFTIEPKNLSQTAVPHWYDEAGNILFAVPKGKLLSNHMPFAVDTLPEISEKEPNNQPTNAQQVTLPTIVNGRIDAPGDWDVFRFEGRKGQKIVADVDARRLDSPLDSVLELTDAAGRRLAFNDDYADKATGRSTHHSDSYILTDLPADGVYYLRLGDAQHKGGPEYAYRLRISEPHPDFTLRIVPSSVNVRAGGSVPLTIYALRKDGFSGDIAFALNDAPQGFSLSKTTLSAKDEQAKLTLSAPKEELDEPIILTIEGRATIEGRPVVRRAVPADDLMQAFIYRHLVPAKMLLVDVTRRIPPRLQLKFLGETPAKLPLGGTTALSFSGPRLPNIDPVQLALKDPPDGITLEKSMIDQDGINLIVRADAEKSKLGQKGNLIVEASIERNLNSGKGKLNVKRRVTLGVLPAIAYEIVAPAK